MLSIDAPGLPKFMNIAGESLGNVYSSNEYLTRMNLMKAYKFPEYDTPKPKGNKVVADNYFITFERIEFHK